MRDILDLQDPVEADLHRNLLQALAVACDDVSLEPALVDELVEKAMALLTTPVHAIARALVRLLGQLIMNGTARFDLCLARVKESGNLDLELIAIEEWGRLDGVKAIDAWLRAELDSDNRRIVSAALDALAPRIGEDAALWQKAVAWLHDRNTSTSAARALARIAPTHPEVRQALMELRTREEWHIRGSVLVALSGLVELDAEVRRLFLNCLEDQAFVAGTAARGLSALARQDPEVREALLKATADKGSAIHALAHLVEEDAEVRRILLKRLGVPHLRVPAVRALSPILGTDSEALAKVAKLLERGEDLSWLLEGLSGCPEVPRIREAFLKAMESTDWRVRRVACQRLGETGAASLDQLLAALHQRDTWEARQIFRWCAMGSEGMAGEEWIAFWMRALSRPEPAARSGAVIALRPWIGADRKIRRAVLKRLEDEDHGVWHAALSALSGIVGTDEEVRRTVLELLNEESTTVRQSALFALSAVVGVDEEVRQAALRWLKEGDSGTRYAALSTLSGIVETDEEVRRSVLERLTDEDFIVRSFALPALSGSVGTDGEVRRLALEWLADGSSVARQSALSALSGIVDTDEEARRLVLERLADKEVDVRRSAVSALSSIVGTDEEVRGAVLARLDDESFWVRQQAVRALAGLVEEAGAVRQAILSKLGDPDFPVRLQVVGVVAKCREEALFESLRVRLWPWLGMDGDGGDPHGIPSEWIRSAQAQLARRFGSRLPADSSLRDDLLAMLRNPRWSVRLGAALALLSWPGGPPRDVLTQVFSALEDPRGLEAYPAQLTAASFLLNQNETAAAAIDLCLEALDYGTQPWEDLYSGQDVRKQAALVLGKLEPISYEPRIYDKLLHVLHHDEDADARDAAYGTLVRLARLRDPSR